MLQNLRSLSAIAGFAIAVIFSWKLLKPPSGHHRRQGKRQISATSNSDSTSSSSQLITSGICSPSDDSGAQNIDNELYQPVKVSGGFVYLPDIKFLKEKNIYIWCLMFENVFTFIPKFQTF